MSLNMRVLQNNIQSINTSLSLLRNTINRLQIDVALLQEVWHPNNPVYINSYFAPIIKLRKGSEGGGVAIIVHQNVKSVHLQEYDMDGLEAVWAEIMLDDLRMVVGSVYIPPGDFSALDLLETVIGKIMCNHDRIIIAADANSRSCLWDDSCLGVSNHLQSLRMGVRLEHIITKYGLYVHNDGSPTYRAVSAPDVTITKGILNYGDVHWSITDDDLGSPHECILFNVGKRAPSGKLEVIDWPRFNWNEYESTTAAALGPLYDKWSVQKDVSTVDLDVMVKELSSCIHNCVSKVATSRIITKHSKPWFCPAISERFKHLRKLKHKCRHRKSPANMSVYRKYLSETLQMLNQSERDYWLSQCKKIETLDDRRKWKAINTLTNQHSSHRVRPIRIQKQGQSDYLFSDKEISAEMEKHYIHIQDPQVSTDEITDFVKSYQFSAYSHRSEDIMNAPISYGEVASTFGTGTPTPGPDKISSTLIDKADRSFMHSCLQFLWSKAWLAGYFFKDCKCEDRAVLPKPGKEDYHQCGSYRTISITDCIGKRFERISSRRLAQVLIDVDFDHHQFAYLKNRSTTQALLLVVEKVKQGLISGKKAGVVFFDFVDAFGTVDRKCLLYKIAKDFGISGKLFLHINSFLTDRVARIKVNGYTGDWIDSLFGTSAGTNLGPLLFIMYLHDLPKAIFPKFADDIVSISVDEDVSQITRELQHAVDDVVTWSHKWGMVLSVPKTKVMLFGDSTGGSIDLMINGFSIEQVDRIKYLGMWLDPLLNFSLHVDYAAATAKRSAARMCNLFDGREGISVQLGVQLYKALVRPHLEYAASVWASAKAKDLDKLDKVQVQCLKSIVGAKSHSSSAAVEVVSGVIPIKIRIRDLCSREFLRLTTSSNCQHLQQLMNTASRDGLNFSPFCYLLLMSKQLSRCLEGCSVSTRSSSPSSAVYSSPKVSLISVVTRGSANFHERSLQEQKEDIDEVKDFINSKAGKSVMVFSDGSVYKGSVGCGACAVVLVPLGNESLITDSKAVGMKVDSVSCELEGILLALKLIVDYFNNVAGRSDKDSVYIFSDCVYAIESVVKRLSVRDHCEFYHRLISLEDELIQFDVAVHLAWIPGHSGVIYNEMADSLARDTAYEIYTGRLSASNVVTYMEAVKMSKDIAKNSWQSKWNHEASGTYTRQLIPEVGRRLFWPDERDIGISYCRLLLHDTMLLEDAYRTGLSDTPVCECGFERVCRTFLVTLHKISRST